MSKGQTIILGNGRQVAHLDHACSKRCEQCDGVFHRDKRCTWRHWEKARFCSRECFGAFEAARKLANRPSKSEAFQKWFDKTDGCWVWNGATDGDGYGCFSYAGKSYRAHRIALELDGRPPGEMFACHHCDNPSCVNPDHLFVGTNKDNMVDMVAKGRNPDRFGPKNPNWRGGRRPK